MFDKITPGASHSLGWEVVLTGLSFPASILLNRALGAEDRGLLGLVILVPSTMFVLATCQWDRLLKGLMTSKQISGREAWHRTIRYLWWLSFIFIPLGMLASWFYPSISQENRWLSVVYCLNFPLFFISGTLSAIYIASGSVEGQYSVRVGLQGSYLVLIFFLFLFLEISVESMVGIYFLIQVFAIGSGWTKKKKLIQGPIKNFQSPFSPLIRGFLPNALESFSGKIDVWAFSLFSTLTTLGHYFGITALMIPVALVSNALTSGSTANLEWTEYAHVRRYLFRTVGVLLSLSIVMILGGSLLGGFLLSILGKSFQGAEWLVPWVVLLLVCQAAAQQFHSALQFSGLQAFYLTTQSLDPFLRLVLVLVFGWLFAEVGIFIGMIMSSLIKVGVCGWLFRRYHPQHDFRRN
ncbi:MAG: hypothetical protein HQM14_19110 [SAR324 cluster bacterium]|nr:hypothetical protein [SAR324 cluster bacterium]